MNDKRTSVIDKIPLLELFPPETKSRVASLFTEERYSFAEVIVREGDEADAFFILVSGKARVIKKAENGEEIPLNVLRPGSEFGEMALLQGGVRTATVRCSSDVKALRLERAKFQELIRENADLRDYIELRIRHRSLHNFLHEFSGLGRVSLPCLRELLENLEQAAYPKGRRIIRQGDGPGPMYIIKEGRLRVFKESDGKVRNLAYLRAGDYFGELSILKDAPRATSVEAYTDSVLLSLSKEALQDLMERFPELREVFEERIGQYDAKREARVPLDFSREMLPADASVHNKVDIDREDEPEAEEEAPPREPFESPEGYFRKRKGRIRGFPMIMQIDRMDCAAASLAMVCRHFGRKVPLSHIRQLCHTAYDGTSLKSICGAATQLGLAARAVKVSLSNLDLMPVPAIVHWDNNHWIVLFDVGAEYVRVADPALGIRRLSRSEFEEKWSGYSALFDFTEDFKDAPESKGPPAWLARFLKPYRWVLAEVLLLAMVTSALGLALPVSTQVIVDRVLVERDMSLLQVMALGLVVVLACIVLVNLLQRYMLSFVAVRIDASLLDFLTRRLLSLPMSYFNTRRTGDIKRRLGGAREVRQFVIQRGLSGLLAIVQIGAYVGIMAVYSFTLFGVYLITVPLYFGLMVFSRKVLRPLFADLEEGYSKYESHQIDAIKGMEGIKAGGAEQIFRNTMLNEFIGLSRKLFRSNLTIMTYENIIHAIGFTSNILFLWVGATMVMNNQLTMGGFVAFNALVAMAYTPIMIFLEMWDETQYISVLLNRLSDIFETEPEQGFDHSNLKPVRTLEGRVEFRRLGFRFGGPESPLILKGISMEVPPGKIVAIVGRSGSGKTTLVKCLSGLLEPSYGTILFDGVDMKGLNYRDLRHQIGYVLQENYMFDDTILHNIAFGELEPDIDRVMWAAHVANAHDFIVRLPLGYDTRIGEGGLKLSGGQVQRVAIARAIYSSPPILILDEATSSLDTESERAIQENMAQLLEGRTTFVIAHRLSTIRNADLIVVLEKGRIAEQGTHEELMELQGLYHYLCSQQMGM